MDIRKRSEELENYVVEQRHWLHQHAELAWQERETTAHIEEELRKMGLEPKRFDDQHTGLYAMIYGGKAGPDAKTIMLRADIDALPIQEETGLPFASVNKGIFHGCGHDAHAAMLLGAAKILTEMQPELTGNVKLLFQGAEETAIGAKYYVDAGVMDHVDAVYGSHITTGFPVGYISVNEGPRHAATDEFRITIEGVGCHGGMPYRGKDATVAAAAVIMNLQTIVSRGTDALDALVITVGKLESGSNYNVVSGHAEMRGTVRSYSREVRTGVEAKMREVVENTAKAFGCTAHLEYQMKTGPVVHDNPMMNKLAHDAVVKLFGEEALYNMRPVGGGDDFAYFCEKAPGLYAMIGAANPKLGTVFDHHHPRFLLDEDAFKRGTAMYAQMAVDFLTQYSG